MIVDGGQRIIWLAKESIPFSHAGLWQTSIKLILWGHSRQQINHTERMLVQTWWRSLFIALLFNDTASVPYKIKSKQYDLNLIMLSLFWRLLCVLVCVVCCIWLLCILLILCNFVFCRELAWFMTNAEPFLPGLLMLSLFHDIVIALIQCKCCAMSKWINIISYHNAWESP